MTKDEIEEAMRLVEEFGRDKWGAGISCAHFDKLGERQHDLDAAETLAALRAHLKGCGGVPEGWSLAPDWKGYALFGTGRYVLNHTPAPMDPELGAEVVVTLATDKDREGNRKVGETRATDPNAPPIQADDMVIRMGFLSPEAIDALEDQLVWLRRENFPDTQPFAARSAPPAPSAAMAKEPQS